LNPRPAVYETAALPLSYFSVPTIGNPLTHRNHSGAYEADFKSMYTNLQNIVGEGKRNSGEVHIDVHPCAALFTAPKIWNEAEFKKNRQQ
jgi:hypothetical protein